VTGAVAALCGASGNSNVNWADISGSLDASNADITMPYAAVITAAVTVTGGWGQLYYVLNGVGPTQYTAAFAVAKGDLLHWDAQTKGTWAGSVRVSRNTTTLIDTFNINLV